MKCSECRGQVMCLEYSVYCPDGSRSGEYRCDSCKKVKKWNVKGKGEKIIDMT